MDMRRIMQVREKRREGCKEREFSCGQCTCPPVTSRDSSAAGPDQHKTPGRIHDGIARRRRWQCSALLAWYFETLVRVRVQVARQHQLQSQSIGAAAPADANPGFQVHQPVVSVHDAPSLMKLLITGNETA